MILTNFLGLCCSETVNLSFKLNQKTQKQLYTHSDKAEADVALTGPSVDSILRDVVDVQQTTGAEEKWVLICHTEIVVALALVAQRVTYHVKIYKTSSP